MGSASGTRPASREMSPVSRASRGSGSWTREFSRGSARVTVRKASPSVIGAIGIGARIRPEAVPDLDDAHRLEGLQPSRTGFQPAPRSFISPGPVGSEAPEGSRRSMMSFLIRSCRSRALAREWRVGLGGSPAVGTVHRSDRQHAAPGDG